MLDCEIPEMLALKNLEFLILTPDATGSNFDSKTIAYQTTVTNFQTYKDA